MGKLFNVLLAEGQQRRDFSLEIKRAMSAGDTKKNGWKTLTAEWKLLKDCSSIYRSHLQEWQAHTSLPFSSAGICVCLPL